MNGSDLGVRVGTITPTIQINIRKVVTRLPGRMAFWMRRLQRLDQRTRAQGVRRRTKLMRIIGAHGRISSHRAYLVIVMEFALVKVRVRNATITKYREALGLSASLVPLLFPFDRVSSP
jgi:hypothetical protein